MTLAKSILMALWKANSMKGCDIHWHPESMEIYQQELIDIVQETINASQGPNETIRLRQDALISKDGSKFLQGPNETGHQISGITPEFPGTGTGISTPGTSDRSTAKLNGTRVTVKVPEQPGRPGVRLSNPIT